MNKLPYVRTMFAACMLFQVIFVLCAALWLVSPDLKGHALLPAIFPNFTLLTVALSMASLQACSMDGLSQSFSSFSITCGLALPEDPEQDISGAMSRDRFAVVGTWRPCRRE